MVSGLGWKSVTLRANGLLWELVPHLHSQAGQIAHLQSAGVPWRTIESLYPLDFENLGDWQAGIQRATQEDEDEYEDEYEIEAVGTTKEVRILTPNIVMLKNLAKQVLLTSAKPSARLLQKRLEDFRRSGYPYFETLSAAELMDLSILALIVLKEGIPVDQKLEEVAVERAGVFLKSVERMLGAMNMLPIRRAQLLFQKLDDCLNPSAEEAREIRQWGVSQSTVASLYPFDLANYAPTVRNMLSDQEALDELIPVLATCQFSRVYGSLPEKSRVQADALAYSDPFFDSEDLASQSASFNLDAGINNAAYCMKQLGHLLLFLHFTATATLPLPQPRPEGVSLVEHLSEAEAVVEALLPGMEDFKARQPR
jgi:hypothetical protein